MKKPNKRFLGHFESRVTHNQTIRGERKAWFTTSGSTASRVHKLKGQFDKGAGKARGNGKNTNQKENNRNQNSKKKGQKQKKQKGDTRFAKLEKKLNAIAKQRTTRKLTPTEKAAKWRDVTCHACNNKGHIKKHCPEAKDTN